MSLGFSLRLFCTIAAILLSGTGTLVKASLTQTAPTHASLTGQLLIATPSMSDPRFARAVILMVKHDRNGALGIVINRPVGERTMAQILEALGETADGAEGRMPIFVGGPVEPQQGFVLHSAEYRRAGTLDVDGRVAMTANREILRDMAAGKGPKKVLIAFGYSGWAPGQLENELKTDAWYTAPADPKLIFDDDRDKVWDNAVARRPRDI
jgi:putative transcriptional regulator